MRLPKNQMLTVRVVTAKILARDPLDEIRRAFALFDADNTGKIRYDAFYVNKLYKTLII
jgi:Ca2+-binding EF-hand superfamily protein